MIDTAVNKPTRRYPVTVLTRAQDQPKIPIVKPLIGLGTVAVYSIPHLE